MSLPVAYVDHRDRSVLLDGAGVRELADAAGVWHAATPTGLVRVALRSLPAVEAVATVRVVHLDGSPCDGVRCEGRA